MNAIAINYSNSIKQPKSAEDLKLSHFEMKVEEQKLHIKLSSPFLNPFNHWCVLKNDTLKIKAKPQKSNLKSIEQALEIPVHIPKKGYTKISKRSFDNQTFI
jgi:hypothetical protein